MTTAGPSQAEADALFAMAKRRSDSAERNYPERGGALSAPVESIDGREKFRLDVRRGRIALGKGSYQNRARATVILARLDFGGAPHRNPDGRRIDSPHIHRYREGYGDKWAFPVPPERFRNLNDLWLTLGDFMAFCNIVDPPDIRYRPRLIP